jgi:hypothetical protein
VSRAKGQTSKETSNKQTKNFAFLRRLLFNPEHGASTFLWGKKSCTSNWSYDVTSQIVVLSKVNIILCYSFEVEIEVTLRLTASQSVCLGVGHPFGAHDQIFFFPFSCQKIALVFVLGRPLWREEGSVICSAICRWSESQRTHNRTLLSQLRLADSLSVASYDSQGLRWKYSYPPPHGDILLNEGNLCKSGYAGCSVTLNFPSAQEWSELIISAVPLKEKLSPKLSAVGPLKRYFSHLRCERLRKETSAMENITKQILPSTHPSHPVAVLQSCHVWFPVYLTKL